jgi:hypothetical protein
LSLSAIGVTWPLLLPAKKTRHIVLFWSWSRSKMHSAEQPASYGWSRFFAQRHALGLWRRLRPWSEGGGVQFGIHRRGINFATALAALALSVGTCIAQQLCPSAGNASGRVVSVDEGLDLALEDGTRLKIGGIDPAGPANPGRPRSRRKWA